MGLDMYLTRRTYIGNDYKKPEEQTKIDVPGVKQERVSYIIENVDYWRKANQIHNWFVENVQNGEDDCREAYVSADNLNELLDIVKQVLDDHSLAESLLPTTSGCFSESQEFDDDYFSDLEETERILESALQEKDAEFYYSSSW